MNKFKVLLLMFAFLFFYGLIKPSVAFACVCASQGSPDYGDPAIIGKEAWCACALSCNDTGTYTNGGCTQAPPEPPSCKTTRICDQNAAGNSPSDCKPSCDGTLATYVCTQSDNPACGGTIHCAGENSRCATTPPAFVCSSGDYGPLSNKTQWCACAAQNKDTGSLINESCPQAPFVCTSGDYGPLSNKTQWCACAAQNNDIGSLINQSCPQAPQPTPTARSSQTASPTPPVKSALTVTKIQINGETMDLKGKLKITLAETFKTLNPQTKIDVTYSDGSTKSFYLGFHYVAPPTATLALSPATDTLNKNCSFSLKINVDTGGNQTDGTDATILYDPSILSLISVNNGTIYPDYPAAPSSQANGNGRVQISGLSKPGSPFSGQGTLATVNFKVSANAPSGTTQVKFNFDPNNKTKTTDSNVVQTGTVNDILSAVTDGNYTIGTDSCTTATPTPTPTAAPTAAPASSATPAPTTTPRPSPTLNPSLRIYDLNGDSKINTFDPATFIKDWENCPPQIDFDRNGKCNARDYSMLKNQL